MRKSPLFLSVLSLMAVFAGCSGSGSDYEEITAADIEEEADLTKIAYDFKIHPLKSSDPLDGIGGVKSWNDGSVMLARTSDSRKILRFDNYKLTGVLDRLGRGPGEYYFIEDFTYDEFNNCIYIENDSNLVTYDAVTMEFKGKQQVNINLQNCLNLGDKMLYFGIFLDEGSLSADEDSLHLPKESMIIVDRDERDLSKGVILYREGLLKRLLLGYPELFYVNPKNLSTCFTGLVCTIVTFDYEKATPIYKFKLGTEPVDEEAERLLDETVSLSSEGAEDVLKRISLATQGPKISNVYNIMVDNGTISFRVTYNWPDGSIGDGSNYLYFVRRDNKTKVYKHLRIPGLSMDVDPTGANGNHQIAIIENLGDLAIDENVPLSPLAEQIVAELKKQNDDNPVMLEFRFK